jgi:hypothetical protein
MKFICGVLIFAICMMAISGQRLPSCTDVCGPNEVYTPCEGSITCQESCNNTHVLPFLKCACLKGCKCKTGFVRDPFTKKCIPRASCTDAPTCGRNEVWSDTMADCQNTCLSINTAFSSCNTAGCVCAPGFIRRSNTVKDCIPIDQCNGKFQQNYPKIR